MLASYKHSSLTVNVVGCRKLSFTNKGWKWHRKLPRMERGKTKRNKTKNYFKLFHQGKMSIVVTNIFEPYFTCWQNKLERFIIVNLSAPIYLCRYGSDNNWLSGASSGVHSGCQQRLEYDIKVWKCQNALD